MDLPADTFTPGTCVRTGKLKALLFISSDSAAVPHRAAPAAARRLHLPDHPAQHQLYPGRWPHYQEGDWVPRQPVAVVRGPRGKHGDI